MKKTLLMTLMLAVALTCNAQRYSVKQRFAQQSDSVEFNKDSHLYKAGRCLSISANYDLLSWGLTGAAALSYAASFNSKKNEEYFRNVAIGFSVAALASRFLSITYKSEAGYELRLSAGTVQVTF